MSSTHTSLHFHIVFGTKNHEPWIAAAWRPRLHGYLGGILNSMNAVAESVGGVEDHVHILAGLRSTVCVADVVREIKSVSSGWVHDEIGLASFAWQEGYGAFTVSPSQRVAVVRYISSQEAHHRSRSIKEEYLDFLEKSGVEFDPRYV